MEKVRFGDEIAKIAKSMVGLRRYKDAYVKDREELPWAVQFMGDVKYRPGVAWCFYFAAACWKKPRTEMHIDLPDFILNSRECLSGLMELAGAAGAISSAPMKGAIAVLYVNGIPQHCGICAGYAPSSGQVLLVEGNTDHGKGSDGNEVWEHAREIAALKFVFDPIHDCLLSKTPDDQKSAASNLWNSRLA